MSNRSNDHLQSSQYLQRDRRGSLGMDSCDYNSNSSGYFDEHADYDHQQHAVYSFQQNTISSSKNQWPSRGKGSHMAQQTNGRSAQLQHSNSQHYAHLPEKDHLPNDSNPREQFLNDKAH